MMEDPIIILESDREEEIGSIKDQNLGSIKGEIMGEVREEKGKLKFLLASLVKDYQSLQQDHKPITATTTQEATKVIKGTSITLEECDDEVLVCLSLGMSSLSKDNNPITRINSNSNNTNRIEEKRELDDDDEGLALGLYVRFDPSSSSPPHHQDEATNNNHSQESSLVEEGKEEEPSEMWPPSKVLKRDKSGASHQQQQTQLKKARVSIRARCDTQTMNDGCQWRKYGQKIAKGNPCPRAYYRCTVSPSCPVRKQVQRCAEDMSILITTYEGTHNHPLPLSATAMASTTSAAASMLQSPSLISSQQALPNSSDIMAPIFNSTTPHQYNTNNNSSTFSSSCQISSPNHQFQFTNSSFYSTSNHNSHPTITLDLTSTSPPPPPSSSSGFSHTPKYSSTNLNFSSNFSPLQSSMQLPPHYSSPWSNYSGFSTQNRSNQGGVYVINSGSSQQQIQGNLHQQQQPIYMNNNQNNIISQHTIAAATKAITTNPKFQSALATALTAYVGNGGVGIGDRLKELNHVADESSAPLMNLKLSSSGGASSSSRYLFNMSSFPNNNAQQENGYSSSSIMFPLALPVSKVSPAVSSNNRINQFLEQWK